MRHWAWARVDGLSAIHNPRYATTVTAFIRLAMIRIMLRLLTATASS
jgi:hypothetical protein